MNLIARGRAMRNRQAAAAAGVTVTIEPADGLGSVTVTDAVLGLQDVNVAQPGQANVRRERDHQDFLVPVASLVRNGLTLLPAIGDRYRVTIGGTEHVFAVLPTGKNAAWDWSDQGRTRLRVRTKRAQ